jgi:thiamine biosynthesis lipoprotein
VDLGGIGKGLTLRWAWRLVRPLLADGAGAMLEAGGDLVADGPSPDGGPWTIGVEDPRGGHSADDPVTRGLLAVVTLERGAIATSSVVVNRWRLPDGRSVHHLIDPSTGEPGGSGLIAVTVAGPDPAWTEVWSKALFLGGAQAIGTEARARGLTAWWVRDDGTLEMTPGARQRTVWTAADA